MGKTLIFGHKNPDTDSICSALAYADLKTTIGADVEAVRLEWGELDEGARDAVTDAGHHRDGEEEDRTKADPARQRGHAPCPFELVGALERSERHRERQDKCHEQRQGNRCPREQVGS